MRRARRNLGALRQPAEQRRGPRILNLVGLAGCLTLVATLPVTSLAAGLAVLAVGLLARAVRMARWPRS